MYKIIFTTIAFLASLFSLAQISSRPLVEYTLRVDSTELSSYQVEMSLKNMPATFRLGMVAHPEYDDRYWRYVEGLQVTSPGVGGNIIREDSAPVPYLPGVRVPWYLFVGRKV